MFDNELDTLSKRNRVAVVATCVEHIMDFYRFGNFSLQVSHAPRDFGLPPDKDLLELALEVAWRFVAIDQADPTEIDAILEGMRQPPKGANPEDMCTAGDTVVTAVAGMLRTITDPTPAEAVDALNSCASAVWDGLVTVLSKRDAGKAGNAEEEGWQKLVIDRAVQRKAATLSRADFADLLLLSLSWQQHLAAYRIEYT